MVCAPVLFEVQISRFVEMVAMLATRVGAVFENRFSEAGQGQQERRAAREYQKRDVDGGQQEVAPGRAARQVMRNGKAHQHEAQKIRARKGFAAKTNGAIRKAQGQRRQHDEAGTRRQRHAGEVGPGAGQAPGSQSHAAREPEIEQHGGHSGDGQDNWQGGFGIGRQFIELGERWD